MAGKGEVVEWWWWQAGRWWHSGTGSGCQCLPKCVRALPIDFSSVCKVVAGCPSIEILLFSLPSLNNTRMAAGMDRWIGQMIKFDVCYKVFIVTDDTETDDTRMSHTGRQGR